MKSKNEKTKLEEDPKNPSRRDAILATGAGVVAAVGATGASSESKTKESSSNKHAPSMEGSTSLITGGARGIGLASALALAKEGSNIVLYDVAEDLPLPPPLRHAPQVAAVAVDHRGAVHSA